MSDLSNIFAAAWSKSGATGAIATDEPAGGRVLLLAGSPAYPLARTVPMPEVAGYETGAIGFRIFDLTAQGMEALKPETVSLVRQDAQTGRLSFGLGRIVVEGRCAIDAKPDPVIPVDFAGSLLDLSDMPQAAGGDASAAADPEKEQWLNQAREQRTELAKSTNGSTLLATYYEHNEAFNDLFSQSPGFVSQWQNGGVTKEMSRDTSAALQQRSTINAKTYSNNLNYNYNSFSQQATVATALAVMATAYDEGTPEYQKYANASTATAGFSTMVTQVTGNAQSTTVPMTSVEIHNTVAKAPNPTLPTILFEDVKKAYNIDPQSGGGSFTSDVSGFELDEATRARIQSVAAAVRKDLAENAAIVGRPLFESGCRAELDGIAFSLTWRRERGRVRIVEAQVTLPAFALDIDDESWIGEAGERARERLGSLQFLHSALEGWIEQGVRAHVLPRTAAILSDIIVNA
ncbi:hypothetical protein ABMY26_04300 [Azospirillum sp. HJ39]|uniref:hypothetical protein n=1 Tax=Azospirillum sp. HJ39 TaxID=3159496 RepID=UPI00355921B4